MAQLPNLDNLSLLGYPAAVDRRELPGIGTVLRGRFGGKLILSDGYAGEDCVNMLLEIPSGLRFTEVQVHCTRGRHLSAIRLAEACARTLVKLSHTVTSNCKSYPSSQIPMLTPFPDIDGWDTFDQFFNFSKSPNLQEVNFGFRVGLKNGGLPWIPGALSTLRPATSPRLSSLRLDLFGPSHYQSVGTLIEWTDSDLLRIADEVGRIDREFEGAVNFTVVPDSKFKAVLDALKVSFCFCNVDETPWLRLFTSLRPLQILQHYGRAGSTVNSRR